jgi:hypothetical protein
MRAQGILRLSQALTLQEMVGDFSLHSKQHEAMVPA